MSSWYHSQPLINYDNEDVAILWEYIESHGLGGIVGAIAQAGGIQNPILDDLGTKRYLSNILYYEQTLALCSYLQDASLRLGFPIVFMKGPTLIDSAYRDPGVRSYSDIDVFVRSYSEGQALLEAIGCSEICDPMREGFFQRLYSPGKLHAWKDGWQIELCYPIDRPSDPMAECLCRLKDRIFSISLCKSTPWAPPPDVHFLYLMLHLCWHFCSRLIWFLDIASFIRHNINEIDLEWVMHELKRLHMRTLPSGITRFCKNVIDQNLVILPRGERGWNDMFFNTMLSVDANILRGDLTVYHQSLRSRMKGYFTSFSRLYLITDPSGHGLREDDTATSWSVERILTAIGLESSFLRKIFVPLAPFVMLPLAYLVAFNFQKPQNSRYNQFSEETRDDLNDTI